MFDDDDFPDYFLEEGDSESQPQPQSKERTPQTGETIVFSGDGSRGHAESDVTSGRRDRHGFGCGFKVGCGLFLLLIIFCAIAYFRYLTPTVDDAVMDVYVQKVERRGVFFKTYEAEIVELQRLADTVSAYTHSCSVTIADERLARRLQSMQSGGTPVRLRYQQYAASLPWRGESKRIIISAE